MSSTDKKATARRFDQRRRRQAERVRLRGKRATPASQTTQAEGARPATVRSVPPREALAERLAQRGGAPARPSGALAQTVRPFPRSQRRSVAPAQAPAAAPEAPPSVLEEFRAGFDRVESAIREAGGLVSRTEMDALREDNESLRRTIEDQQGALAAKDAELDQLRTHLATASADAE